MKTTCIAAAALASLACTSAAQARTTTVGAGGSIQAAVDAAAPGDAIVVRGTHRENVAVGTDALTLTGAGAVLEPPVAPAANACFDPSVAGEAVHGICVSGDIDFDTGEIARRVQRVSVSGFAVRGFSGDGIVAGAAQDATIAGNVTEGNGDAGVATIASHGVRVLGNWTAGNRFGVFAGGSVGGSIAGNTITGNCAGVFAIGQPSPAGGFRIAANGIHHNNRACPASGDWPALSGIGVALVGASDDTVVANVVRDNVPSGESAVSGGVAVLAEPGGAPAERNVVTANVIAGNAPDILWDGAGAGNVFRRNMIGR
jgi:nitrous oxidase accessory protein NosD